MMMNGLAGLLVNKVIYSLDNAHVINEVKYIFHYLLIFILRFTYVLAPI